MVSERPRTSQTAMASSASVHAAAVVMECAALKLSTEEAPPWVIHTMKAKRDPIPSTQKQAEAHPPRARTAPSASRRIRTTRPLEVPMAAPVSASTATRSRSLPAVGMAWR
jgi:hypothetical protein